MAMNYYKIVCAGCESSSWRLIVEGLAVAAPENINDSVAIIRQSMLDLLQCNHCKRVVAVEKSWAGLV
jgi:hypothetical protein